MAFCGWPVAAMCYGELGSFFHSGFILPKTHFFGTLLSKFGPRSMMGSIRTLGGLLPLLAF